MDNPRTQEEALEEVKKYLQSGRIGKIYQESATGEVMLDLMKRYIPLSVLNQT